MRFGAEALHGKQAGRFKGAVAVDLPKETADGTFGATNRGCTRHATGRKPTARMFNVDIGQDKTADFQLVRWE